MQIETIGGANRDDRMIDEGISTALKRVGRCWLRSGTLAQPPDRLFKLADSRLRLLAGFGLGLGIGLGRCAGFGLGLGIGLGRCAGFDLGLNLASADVAGFGLGLNLGLGRLRGL